MIFLEMKFTVRCNKDDERISAKTVCKIVETVQRSKSECLITRGEKTRNAGSVLMLMSLGIQNGDTVTIKCDDKNCVDKIYKILQETK